MAKRATIKPKKPAKLDAEDWLNTPVEDDAPADDESNGAEGGTAGIVVNKSRLGVIVGLSQSYIDKALARGAPYVSKGTRKEGWRINTAAFIAWVKQEAVNAVTPEDPNRLTFEEAKAKKTQAEYERIEMANKQRRRELVTIDEVVAVYREEASIIRSHLMALPGRLAIPASVETDPVAVEALMTDEINIALSNISADNAEAWTDGRGADSNDDAE